MSTNNSFENPLDISQKQEQVLIPEDLRGEISPDVLPEIGDAESEEGFLVRLAKTPRAKKMAQVLALLTVFSAGYIKRDSLYEFAAKDIPLIKVKGERYSWDELQEIAKDNPAVILANPESVLVHPKGLDLIKEAAENGSQYTLDYAEKYMKYLAPEDQRRILETILANYGISQQTKEICDRTQGGNKVLQEAIMMLDGDDFLKNAKYVAETPEGKDRLSAVIQKSSDATLVIASKELIGLGYDREIRDAFERLTDQYIVLNHCAPFIKEKWMEDILRSFLEKDFEYLVFRGDALKEMKGGSELMNEALKKSYEQGFYDTIINSSKTFSFLPSAGYWINKSLESYLQDQYGSVVYHGNELNSISEVDKKLLLRVLEREIKANYSSGLEAYERFKDIPGSEELLKWSVEEDRKNGLVETVYNGSKLPRTPWFIKSLEEAIRRNSSAAVLNFSAYRDLPNAEELLRYSANKIKHSDAEKILQSGENFRNFLWWEDVVRSTAEHFPEKFLDYEAKLRWLKDYDHLLRLGGEEAFRSKPELFLGRLLAMTASGMDRRWISEKAAVASELRPDAALQELSAIKKLPNGGNIIKKAFADCAVKYPTVFLRYFEGEINDKILLRKAVDNALKEDAYTFLHYLSSGSLGKNGINEEKLAFRALLANPSEVLYEIGRPGKLKELLDKHLSSSPNPRERRILEILQGDRDNYAITTRMIRVVTANPGIDSERLNSLVKDDKAYLEFLLGNMDKDQSIGNEVANISLRQVYEINQLHEERDSIRFKSVEGASAEKLYYLMVFGEEEIFTSTFNGLFDRLKTEIAKEGVSGDELLKSVGNRKFRSFIKLTSEFNRLDEFLELMSEKEQENVLRRFVRGIDKEEDMLKEAVIVADSFSAIENKKVLGPLQDEIRKEYSRVVKEGNKEATVVYGLLAGMFGDKAVINEEWIDKMASQYKLANIVEIPSAELFNPDGTNIQEVFFYGDKDGKASFDSFMSQFSAAEWDINHKEKYVHIKSRSGKKIEIFANLPDQPEGIDEINSIFKERKVEKIVVVHRGHSYHASKTIQRIPPEARIVVLGSCGGYANMSRVLTLAPKAHILATKGTGTMRVNDPLLSLINKEIRAGRNVNWRKVWSEAESELGDNRDFQNYIPPHRNLGALFIKAYNENIGGNV